MMCALGVPMDALVLTGAPLSGIPEDIAENPVMSADEFYLDALRHDPLGFDATAHEHVLRERIGECLGDIHEALCSNALPVLLVNGERDVVAPADVAGIWADKLPNATFHMISGGYHDIINDRQHEVVTTLVSDFITREACADFASITRDPADALDKEP
jgi:pimeloyl-ACP methyl ester carboxylesterase